jgi:hypothetical protein
MRTAYTVAECIQEIVCEDIAYAESFGYVADDIAVCDSIESIYQTICTKYDINDPSNRGYEFCMRVAFSIAPELYEFIRESTDRK